VATIETVHYDLGKGVNPRTKKKWDIYQYEIYNFSAPVGNGMANHIGDVMVIQATVNIIASEPSEASLCKLTLEQMPAVTGLFDKRTEAAIKSFQGALSLLLLRADGIVHPGSFGGRTIKAGGPQTTISQLNDEARGASHLKYGWRNLGSGL
jgi:hypothetical protein